MERQNTKKNQQDACAQIRYYLKYSVENKDFDYVYGGGNPNEEWNGGE